MKLGMEGIGETNSRALKSPLLRNVNPLDTRVGVDGSTINVEKDDLHENVGDCGSQFTADPVPKLIS